VICHSYDNDALAVLIRVEQAGVPQSEAGHDIAYAHTVVFACVHCRGSEIEIHGHDCFHHEDVFDHYNWYLLPPADTAQLRSLVEGCPSPLSADCPCPCPRHASHELRIAAVDVVARPCRRGGFHIHRVYLEVKSGRSSIAAERKNSS
jgi:hypothetical protein